MAVSLKLKKSPTLPLTVDALNPDRINHLPHDALEQRLVRHGNRQEPVTEWFDVAGSAEDLVVRWHGQLQRVHGIGAGMTAGHVEIHGGAGRHVASRMSGGTVDAFHDVGDFCGAEMRRGLVRVRGSAADFAGAAYPGSAQGMRGGTLLVHGSVGRQAGQRMRRGLMGVGQNAGPWLAADMLAGTIVVGGAAELPIGAQMRRGTIVILGQSTADPLPNFRAAYHGQPLAIQLVLRELQSLDFPLPDSAWQQLQQFSGDLLEGGRGELFFAGRQSVC